MSTFFLSSSPSVSDSLSVSKSSETNRSTILLSMFGFVQGDSPLKMTGYNVLKRDCGVRCIWPVTAEISISLIIGNL